MKLSKMITQTENEIMNLDESFDFTINKLTADSKNVEQNDIFFAVKGFVTDGNKFIQDAFEKGAKAVITAGEPDIIDSRIQSEGCAQNYGGYEQRILW